MTQSTDITKLSQAMLIVQQQLQPAIKDAKNPFIGNEYATLNSVMESCRNLLSSQGIWLTQLPCPAPVELGAGHIGLETRLIHAESGQWISSVAVIPLPKNDPQGMGSAITYARRYSLCAILGIVTEDDDGNAASITPKQAKTRIRLVEATQRQKVASDNSFIHEQNFRCLKSPRIASPKSAQHRRRELQDGSGGGRKKMHRGVWKNLGEKGAAQGFRVQVGFASTYLVEV